MQSIRCLSLALVVLFTAGCSSFIHGEGPHLPRNAKWGLLPLVNYSQAPLAGERSEQILLSVLDKAGVHPQRYPQRLQGELPLLDDRQRLDQSMDWARRQGLDYVISGSVEEWQYKKGLEGEPAVGISLQVLSPSSGQVLWSSSGARAGWSRESLSGAAQKVLDELVGELEFR